MGSLFCNTDWKDTSRPLLLPLLREGDLHFFLEAACMFQIFCNELEYDFCTYQKALSNLIKE